MTDEGRQRLADGIAAVVRCWMKGDPDDQPTVFVDAHDPTPQHPNGDPPLSPHQLVCLHGLVGLPVPTAAVVDALREAGLIEVENERLVRADERRVCAAFAADKLTDLGYGSRSHLAHRIHEAILGSATP